MDGGRWTAEQSDSYIKAASTIILRDGTRGPLSKEPASSFDVVA